MNRLSRYVLLVVLLPTSLFADEKVIVLNVTGQPPLNTPEQTGFMDEIAGEAFRRIGYRLETVQLPAERGLVNANHGKVDGEMSRVKGLDRRYQNLLRVPEKIMDWEFVGFSHDKISLEKGWSDLAMKSVSHINGWKIFEINVPANAEITKVGNAERLFGLLRRDRTDIVLYERWGGQDLLHKMNMHSVQMCQPPLAVKEMFIYLHKKHRNLIPRLAKALAAMKQDGQYQQIFSKFLMPYDVYEKERQRANIRQ